MGEFTRDGAQSITAQNGHTNSLIPRGNLAYFGQWEETSFENPELTQMNIGKLHTDSNLSSGLNPWPWSCEAAMLPTVPPTITHFNYFSCFITIIFFPEWTGDALILPTYYIYIYAKRKDTKCQFFYESTVAVIQSIRLCKSHACEVPVITNMWLCMLYCNCRRQEGSLFGSYSSLLTLIVKVWDTWEHRTNKKKASKHFACPPSLGPEDRCQEIQCLSLNL